MVVFSSLKQAMREGFHWFAFSRSEKLHIVEMDRDAKPGHRVKLLAFARPSREEMEAHGVLDQDAVEQPEEVIEAAVEAVLEAPADEPAVVDVPEEAHAMEDEEEDLVPSGRCTQHAVSLRCARPRERKFTVLEPSAAATA